MALEQGRDSLVLRARISVLQGPAGHPPHHENGLFSLQIVMALRATTEP